MDILIIGAETRPERQRALQLANQYQEDGYLESKKPGRRHFTYYVPANKQDHEDGAYAWHNASKTRITVKIR